MEKLTLVLIVWIILIVCVLSIVSIQYIQLQDEHAELQQHYEWALEMSKFSGEKREEIIEEVHVNKLPMI